MTEKLMAEWFWTDRWMGSSAFLLPIDARGLYREMLSQAWLRGAKLPADFDAIRRAVGVTEKEWAKAWPKVQKFWRVEGEYLVNDTQLEVYAEASGRRSRAQARAQAGAQALLKHRSSTAQAEPKQVLKHQPPSLSLTDIPNTTPSSDLPAGKAEPAGPARRDAVERVVEATVEPKQSAVDEARAELVAAIKTAKAKRPELDGLSRQEVLDRPEYHAPTGRVRLDSTNVGLLLATAAKLRGETKPRKATAPGWDLPPEDAEAKAKADSARAWIADHWPKDSDPTTWDDVLSLAKILEPPPEIAESVTALLRFEKYPDVYHAAHVAA